MDNGPGGGLLAALGAPGGEGEDAAMDDLDFDDDMALEQASVESYDAGPFATYAKDAMDPELSIQQRSDAFRQMIETVLEEREAPATLRSGGE